MKRLFTIVLCLLLLSAMSVTAFAAGSAQMQVSASAEQVYRGDTVTFDVSISSVENCTAAGFVTQYDSSVFEWVSGSVLVSDAIMKNFAGGTAAVAFESGTPVSGTIFRFTLRVKDSAPFGSTTVSGTPSVKENQQSISSSASGVKLTVACHHEFGTRAKTDDGIHTSQCIHCGEKKTESHSWETVTILQAATCKDTGSKIVKCSGCDFETQQTIPTNDDHKFNRWSQVNGSNHTRTCSVCDLVQTVSHTWNAGKVTKEATCTETGSRSRTCTGCGATKEETVDLAEHSYGPFTRVDGQNHTHTCTVCQKTETLEHTYESPWQHDADGHYLSCDGCGEKKDYSVHIPGTAATDTTPQLCTVCERVLMPELSHAHSFSPNWTTDEKAHWHSCESCIITEGWQEHAYADVCADQCSVCAAPRQPIHAAQSVLQADASGHWYPCNLCGEKLEFTQHTPGPEATVTSAQYCTVCGFEMKGVLPHDPVYDAGTTLHWHECACGERFEAPVDSCEICKANASRNPKEAPWWVLFVTQTVIFGAVILILLIRVGKLRKEAMYKKWKAE